MTGTQFFLIGLLGVVLVLFAWGRWRHDVVAFGALVLATLAGAVPAGEMFSGLGHPATVTVALVLIISRALRSSGAVDLIARSLLPPLERPSHQVGLFAAVGGILSTMMNNVGALALLLPAVLQSAARAGHAPALVLMPLSFGTILGGLATLIGTPPNIIVATFRGEAIGQPFTMFDFTPVGGTVAVAGILFVSLIGWRLIPADRRARPSAGEFEDLENYVSEAIVPPDSKAAGRALEDLDDIAAQHDAVILRLLRNDRRIDLAGRAQDVKEGDLLVIEAGSDNMDAVLKALEVRPPDREARRENLIGTSETSLMQAVILQRSRLEGQTRETMRLRRRYGISLLAVSRRGHFFRGRMRSFRFQAGDILLFEGEEERLAAIVPALGCLPLASRAAAPSSRRPAILSMVLFAAAIIVATAGLAGLPLALAAAAIGMVLLKILPLRDLYESVDWPVIILLGAMIPIGGALQTSGVTGLVADGLVMLTGAWPAAAILAIIIVVTMTLSDIINNAATAVVMAPISLAIADQLGVSADPFLMAVAIGASCAFLTPIGHQNNTLILGPGGYRFADYWRMGLPLEVLIVIVAVPMILLVWPL